MSVNNKHKIVTFGEVMMRLSASQYKRLTQAHQLDVCYGGTEANVSVALSHYGCESIHVTALPNDFTGAAVKGYLNQYGVNTSYVSTSNSPLGLYFLEEGASHRSSEIAYNRNHSAFANCNPADFKWEEILKTADWFHWTGITPAISKNTYLALKNALEQAKLQQVKVVVDPVYRSNLWNYEGANPQKILRELLEYSTVFVGGTEEINMLFDTSYSYAEFKQAAIFLMEKIPSLTSVVNKVRKSKNASWHSISSQCWDGNTLYESDEIEITHIVDRIGTGDAFTSGVIYGLINFDWNQTLAFANACCALKHTIKGDGFLMSDKEVLRTINSGFNGRILR